MHLNQPITVANLRLHNNLSPREFIYKIFSALCAIGIGFGMSRFTYASLVPSLIQESWVTRPQAGFLGGANSIEYMISCVFVALPIRHFGAQRTLQTALIIALVGSFMSSFDLNFEWLIFARFIAGVSAAPLLILTPSIIANTVPDSWQKFQTDWYFLEKVFSQSLQHQRFPFFCIAEFN